MFVSLCCEILLALVFHLGESIYGHCNPGLGHIGESMPSASISSSLHNSKRAVTEIWWNVGSSALVLTALLN